MVCTKLGKFWENRCLFPGVKCLQEMAFAAKVLESLWKMAAFKLLNVKCKRIVLRTLMYLLKSGAIRKECKGEEVLKGSWGHV